MDDARRKKENEREIEIKEKAENTKRLPIKWTMQVYLIC